MSSERFKAVLKAAPQPALAGAPARDRSAAGHRSVMRKIITLIVHYPGAAAGLKPVEGLESVEAPGADLLRRLLEMTAATPNLMPAQLIEAFRDDPEGRYLQRLAAETPLDDEAAAPAVLAGSLEQLVARQRRAAAGRTVRSRPSPAAARGSEGPDPE
jgi:DNA primase